jgi:hypothetical protein
MTGAGAGLSLVTWLQKSKANLWLPMLTITR